MKIAFVKNNKVQEIYAPGAIWSIAKANLRKDWQIIMSCSDNVQADWVYDPATEELKAP